MSVVPLFPILGIGTLTKGEQSRSLPDLHQLKPGNSHALRMKKRSGTSSDLIHPMKPRDDGATSAEDADNSSISSLEVKENQDHKNQGDCDFHQKCYPSTFSTTIARGGTRALKRKQPLADGKDRLLYKSPFTCKRTAWAATQKNALVQLNELRPGLRYEITSTTGPLHAPVFSIGVEVNGRRFEGQGPTKKQAKMRAAELALQSFIQFPNASQAHAAMGSFANTQTDFTADKPDIPTAFLKEFQPPLRETRDLLRRSAGRQELVSGTSKRRRLVRLTVDLLSSADSKKLAFNMSLLEQLSPVALLNELHPGLRYTCLVERVQGRPMRGFIMVLRLEGRIFEGCGHSKRLAKAQVAAAALQALYNVSLGPERKILGLAASRAKNQLPQRFAESIFHLVREKYAELTDNCFSTLHTHHKALAGVVMTRGLDLRQAQVVALGTGTKCVSGGIVSDRWLTVSDCHAEVVTRRAFVRFLYAHLELLLSKQPDGLEESIFVPDKGFGFRLREGLLFHMYVTSSPCGDARLNCPYETINTCPGNHHLVRKIRCHLRMKIEGREGTLPVTAQRANRKLGVTSPAEPLVTMSCTDKMARWSVLGLQGALLSRVVEPVYLHSLTVGTLCHTGHLGRALRRRLTHVGHLPFPFRRKQPLLGCLSCSELRPSGKPPSLSLNWSFGDSGLEEVSSSTGQRKGSASPSRLCRCSLFLRWQRTHQLSGQVLGTEAAAGTYPGSKMAARQYQKARQQFIQAMQDSGLGTWVRKPPEPNYFHASV
ncbi:double-stranded RNA-specific editase B2-like [Lampris incognitus]|uniref:double-stranded RNA-specific editase B2-like n=1 Tax=Lampris incognitus TaxID=2546036 RepID=UPI0024B5CB95|nr:double-stranded RNA-specific editase B2-like [Lampris incognitus]